MLLTVPWSREMLVKTAKLWSWEQSNVYLTGLWNKKEKSKFHKSNYDYLQQSIYFKRHKDFDCLIKIMETASYQLKFESFKIGINNGNL